MKKIKKFEAFIIIVLILKIIAMGFFSSDYQNNLFMKFIYGFINEIGNKGFSNPYSIFKNEINALTISNPNFEFYILGATQLLWINLFTHGFPAIALGLQDSKENYMKKDLDNEKYIWKNNW